MIDGHDMQQIVGALEKARIAQDHPTVIIAKTIKGYGVDRVENKEGFHGKAFSQKELDEILPIFEQRFASAAANGSSFNWQPIVPPKTASIEPCQKPIIIHESLYKKGEQIATRKAYGQSLAQLGAACKQVISLDAEVKNSTFADLFEEKYPATFLSMFHCRAKYGEHGNWISGSRQNSIYFHICLFSFARA